MEIKGNNDPSRVNLENTGANQPQDQKVSGNIKGRIVAKIADCENLSNIAKTISGVFSKASSFIGDAWKTVSTKCSEVFSAAKQTAEKGLGRVSKIFDNSVLSEVHEEELVVPEMSDTEISFEEAAEEVEVSDSSYQSVTESEKDVEDIVNKGLEDLDQLIAEAESAEVEHSPEKIVKETLQEHGMGIDLEALEGSPPQTIINKYDDNKKAFSAANELLNTEKTFNKDIKALRGQLKFLAKDAGLDFKSLIKNLDGIIQKNNKLLKGLEDSISQDAIDAPKVNELFSSADFSEYMEDLGTYTVNYEAALKESEQLGDQGFKLQNDLSKPMQRAMRYQMPLMEMVKGTENNPQLANALKSVETEASKINETKRGADRKLSEAKLSQLKEMINELSGGKRLSVVNGELVVRDKGITPKTRDRIKMSGAEIILKMFDDAINSGVDSTVVKNRIEQFKQVPGLTPAMEEKLGALEDKIARQEAEKFIGFADSKISDLNSLLVVGKNFNNLFESNETWVTDRLENQFPIERFEENITNVQTLKNEMQKNPAKAGEKAMKLNQYSTTNSGTQILNMLDNIRSDMKGRVNDDLLKSQIKVIKQAVDPELKPGEVRPEESEITQAFEQLRNIL